MAWKRSHGKGRSQIYPTIWRSRWSNHGERRWQGPYTCPCLPVVYGSKPAKIRTTVLIIHSGLLRLELVAESPHGDDVARRRRLRLDLGPQPLHVDVEGLGV